MTASTSVDADVANNALGGQWVAGCGADAAPCFRVFNPVIQGEKFDPHGDHVLRWIPEPARVPARWIHKPWEAPTTVLDEAGVKLGAAHPEPIVNHHTTRVRALAALAKLKKGRRQSEGGERARKEAYILPCHSGQASGGARDLESSSPPIPDDRQELLCS
jgi:deoxyribodipyrimidine photo-lyase